MAGVALSAEEFDRRRKRRPRRTRREQARERRGEGSRQQAESAERDTCFPVRYTRQGYARIRAGYKVFGAEDAVKHDVFPGVHEWRGVASYPFVDKALGGHATGR